MREFMTDYWYSVVFVLCMIYGQLINKNSSKGEDCSRAEDDAGY